MKPVPKVMLLKPLAVEHSRSRLGGVVEFAHTDGLGPTPEEHHDWGEYQ
jgi:hypothetical protein